jgi:hypothetical protein
MKLSGGLAQGLSLAVLGVGLARAEIRDMEFLLEPTEDSIHFTDGYLRGPGYIDLSALVFTAVSENFTPVDVGTNDDSPLNDDDNDDNSNAPDDTGADGGNRRDLRARGLDGGVEEGLTTVDMAVIGLPQKCANSRSGCDWTEQGIGGRLPDGNLRWCCSTEAVAAGLCESHNSGKLIINSTSFTGAYKFVNVPPHGPMSKHLRFGQINEANSGQFVVVFANCNEGGRQIVARGKTVWKSVHGYLPGELYGFMNFYAILTGMYLILLLWYGYLMHVNEESRIAIEKWILMTTVLGLLEMFFRTGDYFVWNVDGYRMNLAMYIGIILGVVKRGLSRALIIMVALGWGVVRDSLGSALRTIIVLTAAYVGVSVSRDLMLVFAIEDMETLSYDAEVELFDVVTILTFVVAAVDVIFILWILDALNNTMEYLQSMNQSRKLMRYLRLRCIFLFSILFATIWVVFSLVDTYDENGIIREEHEWSVDAATEINYFYVLAGVAFLWRPNPSAKEYAYVMELSATGEGNDGEDTHELELTGVVPSALDDDDDEEPSGKSNGYHDNDHDDRFRIDDSEAA